MPLYSADEWDGIRRKAGVVEGRLQYAYASVNRLEDPDGSWLRKFRAEATAHGAEVAIDGGVIYLRWENDQ